MGDMLNLTNPNIMEDEISVTQIRAHFDDDSDNTELMEKLEGLLDKAQGDVFTNRFNEVWVVIKVVP
jgi:hypothetical protein